MGKYNLHNADYVCFSNCSHTILLKNSMTEIFNQCECSSVGKFVIDENLFHISD